MNVRVQWVYPFSNIFRDAPGVALAFVLIWGFFCLALGITLYVFRALGLYTMAKHRELSHPWLAWIPLGSSWILGSLSDQYQYVARGKVQNRRRTLLRLGILVFICCVVMMYLSVHLAISAGEYNRYSRFVYEATVESTPVPFLPAFWATIVVAIVYAAFRYISLYNLYRSCNPANATAFLLLSIFVSVTESFLIFASRNQECGMPPRRGQTPCAGYGLDCQPPYQQPRQNHREPPANQ